MQNLIESLNYILPITLLFVVIFYLFRNYFQAKLSVKNNTSEISVGISNKNANMSAQIRLQAYERICLFLERISLNNLLLRVTPADNISVSALQSMLLRDIREEFNHNLSQQIYISDEAWNKTLLAMQNVVFSINRAAMALEPTGNSIELSKKIFSHAFENEKVETQDAILFLKQEVREQLY